MNPFSEILSYSPDSGLFTWLVTRGSKAPKGATAGTPHNAGYVSIRINGKAHLAHRLAWLFATGENPEGEVDHINGDRTDNRISNLRISTRSQQQCNQKLRSDNHQRVKGLGWHDRDKLWTAKVTIQGKTKTRYFKDREDAVAAVRAMREEIHGEFSRHE